MGGWLQAATKARDPLHDCCNASPAPAPTFAVEIRIAVGPPHRHKPADEIHAIEGV
jgi:hypothetical protein